MKKTESLRALVTEYGKTSFEWGAFDCCQLVAKHISNVKGIPNPADEYAYTSLEEAENYLIQQGGVDGIVSRVLGEDSLIEDLDVGDVCVCKLPFVGEVLGLIGGTGVIVPLERGLLPVPQDYIIKGWIL